MLTIMELNALFDRLGTPLAGRRLVEKARREAPVRDIQSRSGNVITWYLSRKMGGIAVGTESRTVEFPAVVQYEHNKKVLEYYPQPCRLDMSLTIEGRRQSARLQHIPDFLIILEDQILIEEWRDERRLEKLAAKYPGRYFKENGEWRFPAAEEHLGKMGIVYRLRSADEHPQQYVSNLIFLSDYLSPSCPPVEQRKIDILLGIVAAKGIVTLRELLEYSEHDDDVEADAIDLLLPRSADAVAADDVYKAIADGHVAFDLVNDDISETHRARVYRDDTMLAFHQRIESSQKSDPLARLEVSFEAGSGVDYDGMTYKIALVGQNSVMLQSEEGTTELSLEVLEKQYAAGKLVVRSAVQKNSEEEEEGIADISSEYLEIALERARQLEYADTAPELVTVSKRTIQRRRKAMREAGESVIDQHLALVPKLTNSGNKKRKIPDEVIKAIEYVVKKFFNTPTNINKGEAYKLFLDACQSAGLKACSDKTFNKELDRLASVRKRKGKRAHYQSQPIVWYLKFDEPIHGVRPFQYVHIDHTPLEILLCSPRLKNAKWRAWLSLAMDAESRDVVGFYLSFEPPSYRSCMMVLRDIVRRHGRMPDMLIVDNGKEFKSYEFKRVCRLYGCSIRYRPAGQPRHGSVIERLFGTTQSQLIHNLSGNTQLMRHVRTVTKSVNPKNFVEWTLPALHGALDYYFGNLYGTEPHPAHGEGPVEHFVSRMAETGMRLHRRVRFDRRFLIETCPAPDAQGTRVVNAERGVKIGHIWYQSKAFSAAGLHKKEIDIRIDPWDIRFVYALVNGYWVQCESKLARRLRQYTAIELRYAFEELAKEHNIKKKDLSPERVAEWLKVLDARNFDERLREQQGEARLVYERLGMTTVEDISHRSGIAPIYPHTISPSSMSTDTSTPPITESEAGSEALVTAEEEEYDLF